MDKNDFEFNYSAPTTEERREIESIRNSYLKPSEQEIKLAHLRKLDFKAKNIPVASALVVGIVGVLIFGLGLSMILEWNLIVWGVVVAIVGVVPMLLGWPTYTLLAKKMKEKYSGEILKLSEELLNDEK